MAGRTYFTEKLNLIHINPEILVTFISPLQGRSQPNTAGGGGTKIISGGAKYLSSFLKFEVKRKRKNAEKKSISFAVYYFCVIFQSNKIDSCKKRTSTYLYQ